MVIQIRSYFFMLSFVILGSNFSSVLCQELPKSKAERLLAQINSLPNTPKLSPLKIVIDKTKNKRYSAAYYLRRPRKFLGLKESKVPEIHLLADYVQYDSDNAVLVTLAHE